MIYCTQALNSGSIIDVLNVIILQVSATRLPSSDINLSQWSMYKWITEITHIPYNTSLRESSCRNRHCSHIIE